MVKCGKIYAIHMQDRHAALDDWRSHKICRKEGNMIKDYEDFKKFILQAQRLI